ncbi:MAG: DsrE family protein, partial [Chloroflexota bacterium]
MSDKLAVILVSADRKVLEMGLVYAKNVMARGWMADMRLYLFGPSEVTIATDPDLKALVTEIIAGGTVPHACKWCSDKYGVG